MYTSCDLLKSSMWWMTKLVSVTMLASYLKVGSRLPSSSAANWEATETHHTMILVKEYKHVRMNCFQGHSKPSQQQTVCTGNYVPLVWLDPGTPSTAMATVTRLKPVGGVRVPSSEYGWWWQEVLCQLLNKHCDNLSGHQLSCLWTGVSKSCDSLYN